MAAEHWKGFNSSGGYFPHEMAYFLTTEAALNPTGPVAARLSDTLGILDSLPKNSLVSFDTITQEVAIFDHRLQHKI